MKIAFYIGSLSQGGAERVIVNLASYFQSVGYEVVMVNYFIGKNEYQLPGGIKRYLVDLTEEEVSQNRIKNLYRRLMKLRNVWKMERPDVIVSFIGKTNLMTIATSRLLHIPVAVSVRSVPAREYASRGLNLGMRILFPMADGVILQTSQAKEYFSQAIQRKAIILPNSLNPSFIVPLYEGERKKEIVTVGRIDQNKNQLLLVEAFAELSQEHQIKDWCLKLYGDGPEREKIEQYCKERQIQDVIKLMGSQSDIPGRIRESSIFVLPSKQEGMPNALIEAMALGLAVISTDCPCGGPRDIIENDKNGILIPVDDKEALKEKLLLLIRDEDKRRNLGKNAYHIGEKLHPDKVNAMWKDYIDELVKTYK